MRSSACYTPKRSRAYERPVPQAGGGVNGWIFRTAMSLHQKPDDEVEALIRDRVAGCGRVVPDREIKRAIASAKRYTSEGTGLPTGPRVLAWPALDRERVQQVCSSDYTVSRLIERSAEIPAQAQLLEDLFPGNPLLCIGPSNNRVSVEQLSVFTSTPTVLGRQQFIVPSPMIAKQGMNQESRLSRRCLNNTGPRQYLVVEFDGHSLDDQAAILNHLSRYAPLALLVHSGNKSLHGWFYVHGVAEEKVKKFFRYAVSLGADRATWNRCQLVRLPFGHRDNGNTQSVLYFNPILKND